MADPTPGMTAQAPLSLIQTPVPDLRDAVVGRNQEALGWLAAWVAGHSTKGSEATAQHGELAATGSLPATSLLLWGASGAGKTFWLQASAARCEGQHVFDLRQAGQSEALIDAIARDQGRPLWIVDNIDRASPNAQQALFALFIAMQQSSQQRGQRLVATASAAPAQLSGQMRDDLRSRLGQGLVFELHELSDPEKLEALRERAFRLGWMAAASATDYDHLFTYMLVRLPRQLGQLMHLLEALDQRALSLKRPVTLPLMRSLIDENLSLF